MQRAILFILLLAFTVLARPAVAQGLLQKFSKDTAGIKPVVPARQSILPTAAQTPNNIPINFATCNYGIFCRTEVKLDKVTPVKVRFRLGSAQQTDWLEGKPGAVHP